MAFRKKANLILTHNPDILVIPECEHPDKINFDSFSGIPTSFYWFGSNSNKGLGVFSFNSFSLTPLEKNENDFKTIIPIRVKSESIECTLFAIWANNPKDPDGHYIEQVWKALNYYENILNEKNTILIGDFNSNKIWDKKHRESNHSNVVARLEEKGIFSSYHLYHKQKQGNEKHPTIYLYRHQNRPYHIDYCFLSKDLADNIENVEIGDFEHWIKYSDHVPLIVTIKM